MIHSYAVGFLSIIAQASARLPAASSEPDAGLAWCGLPRFLTHAAAALACRARPRRATGRPGAAAGSHLPCHSLAHSQPHVPLGEFAR